MKILFYYRGAESFGIEYISALLKEAGHKTELIFDPGFDDTFFFKSNLLNFLKVKEKLLSQAKRFSPDLVAFSCITNLYPYVKDMARLLKKELKVPTVIGGIHATTLPDYVLKEDCFDIVCTGEGEYAMLELADRMEAGKDFSDIKNLWVKRDGKITFNDERPLIADLDSLPFPDKDIFYKNGAFWKTVQMVASRGCHYHCTFCVNNYYLKRYGRSILRLRRVDSVIEEIKIYKQKYKPEFIDFRDDIFIASMPWVEEFSDKYSKEIGIKFLANVHPRMINKNMSRLLKKAGCWGVCMGIQSGDESIRRNLLKRNETDEEIMKAVRLVKEEGLHLNTEFIFGLPGESTEQAWKSVSLNDEIKPNSTATFLFYPFPGTELMEYSYKNGFLNDNTVGMIKEGVGSYHTILFLKNQNNNFFYNLNCLLPVFVKMRWLIKRKFFKKICEAKTTFLHKIIGIYAIPFYNPKLFKEKLLNYISMLLVFLKRRV